MCICGGWNSVSFENKYGILYIELYSTFRTYLAFFNVCMLCLIYDAQNQDRISR